MLQNGSTSVGQRFVTNAPHDLVGEIWVEKLLVTGGAGYIGSHAVVALVEAGYTPVIVDNFSNSTEQLAAAIDKIADRPVKLYEGDCADIDFVRHILRTEGDVSGVMHFAAYKAVGESVENPLKYYQNNIGALLGVLGAMKDFKITDIVFSSSCTVYGEPADLPVTELSPSSNATSPYGRTKQICEQILRDETMSTDSQIRAISLRYFNPIGAHPSANIGEQPIGMPNNLVPFVTQTAAGLRHELTVFGDDYDTQDGTCVRDYIHVVDLAKAHVEAAKYLSRSNQQSLYDAVNLGTGLGNSVLEVISSFEQVAGLQLSYRLGPASSRRRG